MIENYTTTEPSPMPRSRWHHVINIILGIIALLLVIQLASTITDHQWDFRTYYYAARVAAEGHDPYNVDLTRAMAGEYVHQYLYPPMALWLFRPIALLPFETARQVWYWLHVGLLALLIGIWRSVLTGFERFWILVLLVLLAFNSAVYVDLKAGNITVIEQLCLWAGFLCLMRRKTAWFCALVVAASLFKGLPLLFLGALFLLTVERRWLYAAGSLTLFGLVQFIDYVREPNLYMRFFSISSTWDERGSEFNPSMLALGRDLVGQAAKRGLSESSAKFVMYLTLGIIMAGVAAVSWRVTRRWLAALQGRVSHSEATLTALLSITLAFPLVVPRFKVYAFMLVLPAVYVTILRYGQKLIAPLAVLAVALTPHPHFKIDQWAIDLFWWYYPLTVLVFVWAAWIRGLSRDALPSD